jgi:hypothetical protein
VAKPQTLERRRLNAFRLAQLLMCDLTRWELHFVADVAQRKRVSPKQQAIIDELVDRYLQEARS